MTSLFFIMLVLFIVCVVKMKGINTQLDKEVNAKEEQLRKIEELNNSIKEIDNKYFEYDEQFKRHTLKDIEVSFNTYSSNINDIGQEQLDKLLKAGQAIVRFMNSAKNKIPEAQYILIVEGQSSKDYYTRNYELSYERALALIKSVDERHPGALKSIICIVSGFKPSNSCRYFFLAGVFNKNE